MKKPALYVLFGSLGGTVHATCSCTFDGGEYPHDAKEGMEKLGGNVTFFGKSSG